MKSPNLRHCQARSQNKGLTRASRLQTGPSPQETGRGGQSEMERGNHSRREASSTKLQAGFIANQDFLGFWMVDIRWEGCSQRSAPQKRRTPHLRRRIGCTPRKPSSRDGGGDKSQRPCLPNTWSPELLGPGKGTKRRPESARLWSTPVPEPERLRPGKCIQPRAGLEQFRTEQPRA